MLGPMDEFPVHQIPQPIAWPGSSDRNFYDRSYFNAHDRTGDIFLITGIGYYPNLGVKDAFVLVRRGDTQTAVHLSRRDRPGPAQPARAGLPRRGQRAAAASCASSSTRPRASPSTSPGTGCSTSSRSSATCCARATASRWTRSGSPRWAVWSGVIAIDGEEITVDPDVWIGSRDRSWGIRPIGEAEPAGRPAIRRSRACGGSTCRWRSTNSRSC